MATQAAPRHFSELSLSSSRTNPIDLTSDDLYVPEPPSPELDTRTPKRARLDSAPTDSDANSFTRSPPTSRASLSRSAFPSAPSLQTTSNHSAAPSSSSQGFVNPSVFSSPLNPLNHNHPQHSNSVPNLPSLPSSSQSSFSSFPLAPQSRFAGPSNSSAFFGARNQHNHPGNQPPLSQPSPFVENRLAQPGLSATPSSSSSSSQIIDLTGNTPSPPPSARSLPSIHQHPPAPSFGQQPLPADLPPKTPVCIGQLTVTALVLYPVSYLNARRPNSGEIEWGPVRLNYERQAHKTTPDTIHIRPQLMKGQSAPPEDGNVDNFGVVEQKVASFIGPMLGKGLIRLDGFIRRGLHNVSDLRN